MIKVVKVYIIIIHRKLEILEALRLYFVAYSRYSREEKSLYGIDHWWIFRSSYRKLAWVGFEPTTTEFRSDALTDWAIRPWVQLALRANFVQLLQFHLFVQCSRLISVFAFVSCHICFKRSLERIEIRITVVTIWVIIL